MSHLARIQPATRAEFRAWLQQNHATESSVWLVLQKKQARRNSTDLLLEEAVDEALCFGWIDSKAQTVDEQRYQVYMSVRKPKSTWSRINKEKVERLIESGLMMPAGQAAIDRAKKNGSWTIFDEPEAGVVPAELETALGSAGALEQFQALPERRRINTLAWIALAKRAETRTRRIDKTVEAALDGRAPI